MQVLGLARREVAMGLFWHAVTFGAGYVAGSRIGDKPVVAVRDAFGQARERATTLADRTGEMVPRASSGAAGRTMDIREIREVMTAAPETVELNAPIRDAAALMEHADIGNVIVVDNEQIRGIVTDRDIAVRVIAAGRDPVTTTVADVMTIFPATIAPMASVHEAVELMRKHDVRRLPVVEAGRPIGVVALADLSASPEAQALLADISYAPPNT